MNKIGRISYKFSLLFRAFFFLYPILVITYWMLPLPDKYFFSASRLPLDLKLEMVRGALRCYACILDMIPTVITMMTFYYLVKLFQLYANNIIFSDQNVSYLRKIGLLFFYQVIASIVIQPIISMILTFDAAKGGHIISLSFGGEDVSRLVIAGIAILISWIMEEGRKLEEETALTV